jgi:hypothetical protein
MTLTSTTEKVVLALQGTPMLMTLLVINLAVLGMVTYLVVTAAQMRQVERSELVQALTKCIDRKL